jgi:DNA repair ATPase RecN
MAKKKSFPKPPKAPKSNSPQALASYERRITGWNKKCAEIKKHNDSIEANKKKKEALKMRVAKIRAASKK